jgi:hypothetical protein
MVLIKMRITEPIHSFVAHSQKYCNLNPAGLLYKNKPSTGKSLTLTVAVSSLRQRFFLPSIPQSPAAGPKLYPSPKKAAPAPIIQFVRDARR